MRLAFGLGAAVLLAGCGAARQDAHEPSRSYAMEVVQARFPAKQAVARPVTLQMQVRNSSGATAPNVAISVDSLTYQSSYPELAERTRPIWAVERGPGTVPSLPVETQEVSLPGSGQTAYVNTWALGPLASGGTRSFEWHLVPVRAGTYTVRYTVAAGLAGRARARLAGGGAVQGSFTVDVAGAPPVTHVDPATGHVVAGAAPLVP